MTVIAAILHRLRELRRDKRGAMAPAIAVLGVPLLLSVGLALDVALYYTGNRELRVATEAAAMAAAMDPSQAEARARSYLVSNGYSDPAVLKRVEVGYYCADINRASGARFSLTPDRTNCAGSSVANAVRLTTGRPSKRFLTGTLGSMSPIPDLADTAAAARIDEAGISVTTGLLTVTNTLIQSVNNLLGTLLGVQLRLSSADIEALMGGTVDAGRFFDALAQRTGQSGTYQQLVQGTYGIGDIANAAADAAYSPGTATALRTFAAASGNAYRVPMAGLFGLGVWKNMPVGGANVQPALRAGLNAYQLISYSVQSGPGAINASHLVSLVVPNSTVVVRAVGTGLPDRPRFAFGPAGETTVGTSMLRLQVDVRLLNLNVLNLVGGEATVPLVIDVDAANATVANIDCAGETEQSSRTRVTTTVNSGLVNVYLGQLTNPNAMTKPLPPLSDSDFAYGRILDLSVLNLLGGGLSVTSIQGRAIVKPVLGRQSASVVFGPGGAGTIGSATTQGQGVVVGNRLQVGATLRGVADNVKLKSCVLGLCVDTQDTQLLRTVTGVVGNVGDLLGSTTDPLLDNLLAALGVQLGHATVWTTGARCGVPVLI